MIRFRIGIGCQCLNTIGGEVVSGEDMEEDVSSLLAAASKAMGRMPDTGEPEDCLIIQKEAFILNEWGYGPMFDFEVYAYGPYSDELEKAYAGLGSFPVDTDVPDEVIGRLAEIVRRGPEYLEAYSLLLMIKTSSPESSKGDIMDWAEHIRPRIAHLVREASLSLF